VKTYDATEESKAWNDMYMKNPSLPWSDGHWTDGICWKSLMSDGYTHVRTCEGLFEITKWGRGSRVE
jgi:hypothetical protein